MLGIVCTLFYLIPVAGLQSRGDYLFFFFFGRLRKRISQVRRLIQRHSQQVTGSGFGPELPPCL